MERIDNGFHYRLLSRMTNLPGQFPFTRGIYPGMYRDRAWTMRQYAGFGTAEESNARYRYLIAQGSTGLSVAFDLPTQMGYDADAPMADGEVGKAGVAISTLADMETLFDGIPLDKVSTSMTINATAAILLAMYIVVAEKQGVGPEKISGTVQNDLLKEFAARGTYIYPPVPSLRLTTDIIEYCAKSVPRWNPISISGYHIREAGSTAAQEVAFTLADGLAYVQDAVNRGLDVNSFGPRLSFFFNAHNNFIEEIAKFRAARTLWAELMRKRFNADDRACQLRFHTQTGGSTLTAQQINNNIVRVAFQALAGVLGGTQSLHTNGRDEALALPTEDSVRIALRTQQIIANETGITNTADPVGGSYVIEAETERIMTEARAIIEKIDAMGGAVAAIESGYVTREIQNAAFNTQKEIESGAQNIVGVNKYVSDDGRGTKDENSRDGIAIMKANPALQEKQIQRLAATKSARNTAAVNATLTTLEHAARGQTNLMPLIMDAVRAYATMGEISNTLRKVFGEYQDHSAV